MCIYVYIFIYVYLYIYKWFCNTQCSSLEWKSRIAMPIRTRNLNERFPTRWTTNLSLPLESAWHVTKTVAAMAWGHFFAG